VIINVRGTSGSGKSFLVNQLMGDYPIRLRYKETGRKRPIGYLCQNEHRRSLAVLGHYEIACGGCDTLPTLERIFELVRQAHHAGYHVLFEGLLVNSDRRRTIEMHQDGLPLTVVTLSTPLDECLDAVRDRRARKAKNREPKPLNPRNTETKYDLALVNHERFLQAGLESLLMTRKDALDHVRALVST
jgi:hypothetical protein